MKKKVKIYLGECVKNRETLDGIHKTFMEGNEIVHKIILNKDSKKINNTLIHELIHSALNDLIIEARTKHHDESLVKLGLRINKREDFICHLANYLESNINFVIKEDP